MLSPCVDNGPPVVWPVENKSPAYFYAFEVSSAALAPSNSSLAEKDGNSINRSDVDQGISWFQFWVPFIVFCFSLTTLSFCYSDNCLP
eukprot:scaffold3156_cov268-Chaetoceros_neogracile.AAC.42